MAAGGQGGMLGLADKLLYIEWVKKKVLLYSAGNFIQYLIIIYNKNEYVIYMYL